MFSVCRRRPLALPLSCAFARLCLFLPQCFFSRVCMRARERKNVCFSLVGQVSNFGTDGLLSATVPSLCHTTRVRRWRCLLFERSNTLIPLVAGNPHPEKHIRANKSGRGKHRALGERKRDNNSRWDGRQISIPFSDRQPYRAVGGV